jgi:hypothetical protein
MTGSFFQRLKNQLEDLATAPDDIYQYGKYQLAISDLKNEAYEQDISLAREEKEYLKDTAIEHLKMGDRSAFHKLCSILAFIGMKPQHGRTETTLILSGDTEASMIQSDLKEGCAKPFDIAIGLLHEAGVFESDEEVLYYDAGILGVQKREVGRTGLLVLTNRRIVAVGGFFEGSGSKRHKLFYGELREPYLSRADFVYLDGLTKIELKKDKIQAKYVTEYIIEKDRTFYGPYFFKFDLPTSFKAKSGEVKVFVSVFDTEKGGFRYDKIRIVEFYNRMQAILN